MGIDDFSTFIGTYGRGKRNQYAPSVREIPAARVIVCDLLPTIYRAAWMRGVPVSHRRRAVAAHAEDERKGLVEPPPGDASPPPLDVEQFSQKDEYPLDAFENDAEADRADRARAAPTLDEIAAWLLKPYVEFFERSDSPVLCVISADYRDRVTNLKAPVQDARRKNSRRRRQSASAVDPHTGREDDAREYPSGTRIRLTWYADGTVAGDLVEPPPPQSSSSSSSSSQPHEYSSAANVRGQPWTRHIPVPQMPRSEPSLGVDVLRLMHTPGRELYDDLMTYIEAYAISSAVKWPINTRLVLALRSGEPPLYVYGARRDIVRDPAIRRMLRIVDGPSRDGVPSHRPVPIPGSHLNTIRLYTMSRHANSKSPHRIGEADYSIVHWMEHIVDAFAAEGVHPSTILHSVDSDTCAAALFRMMRRQDNGTSIQSKIYWQGSPSGTWDLNELAQALRDWGWGPYELATAMILSGCDNLPKRELTHGVGAPNIWEAIRLYPNPHEPGTPPYLDYALRLVYSIVFFRHETREEAGGDPSLAAGARGPKTKRGESSSRTLFVPGSVQIRRDVAPSLAGHADAVAPLPPRDPPSWNLIFSDESRTKPRSVEIRNGPVSISPAGLTKKQLGKFCAAWAYFTSIGERDAPSERVALMLDSIAEPSSQ